MVAADADEAGAALGGVMPNRHSTLARRSRTLSRTPQRGFSCCDMVLLEVVQRGERLPLPLLNCCAGCGLLLILASVLGSRETRIVART